MKRLRSVWANVKTKIRNYLIKKFDLRPQIVYKERDIETIGFSRIVSNRDAQLYPNIVTNYVKDEIAQEVGKYIIEHYLYEWKSFQDPIRGDFNYKVYVKVVKPHDDLRED